MDRRHKSVLRRHGQRIQIGEAIVTVTFPAGRGRRVDLHVDAPADLRITLLDALDIDNRTESATNFDGTE